MLLFCKLYYCKGNAKLIFWYYLCYYTDGAVKSSVNIDGNDIKDKIIFISYNSKIVEMFITNDCVLKLFNRFLL